jgi:hypothetical protein
VFIPTLHYHLSNHGPAFGRTGDWSHAIYLHNIIPADTYMRMNTCKERWIGPQCAIRVDPNKLKFPLASADSFTKMFIEGDHRNMDIICRI